MFEAAGEYENVINMAFLAVTGFIAYHGIRFRDDDGKPEFVHLLFGAIAAVFFFMVLFQDVLKLVTFY